MRRLKAAILAGLLVAGFTGQTAQAQRGIQILRDTETERVLRSYQDPFSKAAGLTPSAVKLYIVNDPTPNAFVAEGQNIFMHTGMMLYVRNPNELKGVMAHETGHIAGGHLSRGSDAIAKASVPMLLSMALGVAAMVAGAGDAGMAILMGGQTIAQGVFTSFSRTQEATADQMAMRYLTATKQSGRGMAAVFSRFADEEAMLMDQRDNFGRSHPASRERVSSLETLVNASPYRDAYDSDTDLAAYRMIQAKVAGYVLPVSAALTRYPPSDMSKPARYARAMAYFRQPNLQKALAEIQSLIQDEPNNPYFHEVLGQIYVSMSKPQLGITPYQKAVDLLPDAPQLRVGLANALLATERPGLAQPALDHLKIALASENDDAFAWFEMAKAYSLLGNEPMANLSTAERYFNIGAYQQAAAFATRAQRVLKTGTPDWQRAADIASVSGPEAAKQRRR